MIKIQRAKLRVSIAFCVILALVLPVFLAGCIGGDKETIEIKGSTTLLPFVEAAAQEYMDQNSDVKITVSGGGSGTGITAIGEGTVDIGMSSRELKSSEVAAYPNLVTHVVAKDGLAIIVNTGNNVSGLTKDQVKQIYNGSITNWNQVGGASGTIVVVGRDSTSGTRGTFDELVLGSGTPVTTMEELASNGAIYEKLKNTPGAIGYVGLGYIDSNVKALPINGVSPSIATVQDGTYPIARNLNLYTNGAPTGAVKDFIDFLMSKEGQAIIEAEGFVPIA